MEMKLTPHDILAEQQRIFKEEILPEIGFDPGEKFGQDAAYVAWVVALNCDDRMRIVKGRPTEKSTEIADGFQSARAAEKEVKDILELVKLIFKEQTKGTKNPKTRTYHSSRFGPVRIDHLRKAHRTIWEWLLADEENIEKLRGYMEKYRGKDNVANVGIIELMITPLPDGFEL
jgi:hypothetical protein